MSNLTAEQEAAKARLPFSSVFGYGLGDFANNLAFLL